MEGHSCVMQKTIQAYIEFEIVPVRRITSGLADVENHGLNLLRRI